MFKRRLLAVLPSIILVLCARWGYGQSPALEQPATPEALQAALERRIGATDLGGGTLAVLIQEYPSGRVIYSREPLTPLKPASCNKLHTTAAALYYLGADFHFETPLLALGEVRRGTLHGDLLVRGSGDPAISARFQRDKSDLTAILRSWAQQLAELGIRRVAGRIIGDDDYFDDQYFGQGWYPRERAEWYCAEISALSFNDNCVDLIIRGGKAPGEFASIEVLPSIDYVQIHNRVLTRSPDSREFVSFFRNDRSNVIEARGSVRPGSERREWAAVYNPTLFFVATLRATLIAEGIRVDGQAVDLDDLPPDQRPVAKHALLAGGGERITKGAGSNGQTLSADDHITTVGVLTSPPLRDIIGVINLNSQNFYAECVLKTIGRRMRGEGSFAAGCAAVEDFLKREGLWTPGSTLVDGSGLSYHNRTSAEQLVRVLRWVRQRPQWWPLYRDSLPQGGRTGTLNKRFQHRPEARAAAPQIYGKTGYIGGVRSMAGVIYTESGRELHYAFIANDFNARDTAVLELLDDLATLCARSRF
ncbi:MAG: D-alanyl-D-alanine carboxypeptidase/D-alanyl-D-alanine-endopeptidase [Candidatus Sumerlaeia bacterium]